MSSSSPKKAVITIIAVLLAVAFINSESIYTTTVGGENSIAKTAGLFYASLAMNLKSRITPQQVIIMNPENDGGSSSTKNSNQPKSQNSTQNP